tara:strand:- start:2050 stop:2466 length:417 start_codon:yes stop_codon:yes gene_type:complete
MDDKLKYSAIVPAPSPNLEGVVANQVSQLDSTSFIAIAVAVFCLYSFWKIGTWAGSLITKRVDRFFEQIDNLLSDGQKEREMHLKTMMKFANKIGAVEAKLEAVDDTLKELKIEVQGKAIERLERKIKNKPIDTERSS